MKKKRVNIIAVAMMTLSLSSVWAQEPIAPAMTESEMETMPGMDRSKMNQGAKSEQADSGHIMSGSPKQTGHDMTNMKKDDDMESGSMPMSMQGGEAPQDARSPDYSNGYDFGSIPRPVLADEHNFASLLVDRLENVESDNNSSVTYDLQAWFGRDYDRAVLKAEGDIDSDKLQEARTELLWGHAIATFWDTQLGVRYDSSEEGPDRTWLAFGVQGLAPYWFEVDATAYVGEQGRLGFTLKGEYELLLTQKLVLQPRIEIDMYSKRDAARDLGSGVTEISAGLRLRYEFKREIAPYIGVEWVNKFGETKDFTRTVGEDPSEARFVAGLRFWL